MPSRISGSGRPAKRAIFSQQTIRLLCTRLIYRPTIDAGPRRGVKLVSTQPGVFLQRRMLNHFPMTRTRNKFASALTSRTCYS